MVIIFFLLLIFFIITIISKFSSWEQSDYFLSIDHDKVDTWVYNQISQNLIKKLNQFNANLLIKQWDYKSALNFITWVDYESYYNRWTLKTLIAYEKALGNNFSWLFLANNMIQGAIKDFDTAKKINLNTELETYIDKNLSVSNQLWVILQIKTCYSQWSTTIAWLDNISNKIDQTSKLIDQESLYLKKAKSLIDQSDNKCFDKLQNITNTSSDKLSQLNKNIKNNKSKKENDLIRQINDPSLCLDNNIINIDEMLKSSDKSLDEFQKNHNDSLNAFQSKDANLIQQICEQTKNDSQVNEKVQNSIDQLLQALDGQSKSTEQTIQKWSTSPQYKEILNDEDKQLLKEIEDTNQKWINETQDIKWKWNYHSDNYLIRLFNQFFWNTWNFDNLNN